MPMSDEEQGRTPIAVLLQWVEDWRKRTGAARELQDCGEQRDRILDDLQLSAADLGLFWRLNGGDAALLPEMLETLGIDPSELARTQPMVLRDLERCCGTCHNKKACREDLDSGDPEANYKSYCVNAMTLEALLPQP